MKAIKLLYLSLVAAMMVGCSLDQDPISDATELTEGVLNDSATFILSPFEVTWYMLSVYWNDS